MLCTTDVLPLIYRHTASYHVFDLFCLWNTELFKENKICKTYILANAVNPHQELQTSSGTAVEKMGIRYFISNKTPHLMVDNRSLYQYWQITSVVLFLFCFCLVFFQRSTFVLADHQFTSSIYYSWVRAPSKARVVFLSKKLYTNCLVLVGSRNGFERDFTIELK